MRQPVTDVGVTYRSKPVLASPATVATVPAAVPGVGAAVPPEPAAVLSPLPPEPDISITIATAAAISATPPSAAHSIVRDFRGCMMPAPNVDIGSNESGRADELDADDSMRSSNSADGWRGSGGPGIGPEPEAGPVNAGPAGKPGAGGKPGAANDGAAGP